VTVQRICTKHGRIGCKCGKKRAWDDGGRRRQRTKSGWAQQKDAKFVLLKHQTVCHVCGLAGATEVDHVIPLSQGGTDDLGNKRPIHSTPCHRDKTAGEAKRGRGLS
jgi:5-methylcytosine-specific restriction protein A